MMMGQGAEQGEDKEEPEQRKFCMGVEAYGALGLLGPDFKTQEAKVRNPRPPPDPEAKRGFAAEFMTEAATLTADELGFSTQDLRRQSLTATGGKRYKLELGS